MANIWQELNPPFLALAPMDDLSDTVFRSLLVRYGAPDLFFSEFVAAKSVIDNDRFARTKLSFHKQEQPLIAQIWGRDEKQFYQASQIIADRGFAGIDINMGCPKKKLTAKGCCAGLMHEFELAQRLIHSCRQGGKGLPVSVKTRIGWHDFDQSWLRCLLETQLDALTLHYRVARPAKQHINHNDLGIWQTLKHLLPKAVADGPADGRFFQQVVSLRNRIAPQTVLVNNGGLFSTQLLKILDDQHEGRMIARAALENPFFFRAHRRLGVNFDEMNNRERYNFALEHLSLHRLHYAQDFSGRRFPVMKKFMVCYLKNQQLKTQLLHSNSYEEAEKLLRQAKERSL